MSKFARASAQTDPTKITNYEGATSYKSPEATELYKIASASLLEDQFYQSTPEMLDRIAHLVKSADPKFTSNLASYCRNEMNLRSIPIVLAVLLCRTHGGAIARKCISRIVKRPDEITECLSFFQSINTPNFRDTKKLAKLPNSLKLGLRDVFESGRFDEYQYAKYNRKTEITMKDALFLTHPREIPHTIDIDKSMEKGEIVGLHKKIIDGTLKTPYTWETEISNAGKKENPCVEKAIAWEKLITSGRLPHMAALRNLRNILNLKLNPRAIRLALQSIVDGASKGKQFPFRYWSALKAIRDSSSDYDPFTVQEVNASLAEALNNSVRNMPFLEGRVHISIDVSGSMDAVVSKMGTMTRWEIGAVLGALTAKNPMPNSTTTMSLFASHMLLLSNEGSSPLQIVRSVEKVAREGSIGYATDAWQVPQLLINRKIECDYLVIFTDEQFWNSQSRPMGDGFEFDIELTKYQSLYPHCTAIIVDLAGYGKSPIRIIKGKRIQVTGFSDRIFEAINAELKGESIIQLITNYDGSNHAT